MKKRRRESKTDYRLRRNLLKSGKDRIVIRRTNKYFIVQIVRSDESRDRVIKTVSSRDLLKNGWDKKFKGSLKSIPAGYLTGLLLAKKIGKGEFIIDLGMARIIAGSRIFSVVKGLIDGGLKIPVEENVFPNEDKVSGEHLSDGLKKIIAGVKSKI